TNGIYHTDGLFYSQPGRPKYYVATDNLERHHYQGLLPQDLMDIIASQQLHFDSSSKTGTIFHLMGCLSEYGKLGLTSIGNSPDEAEAIYQRVIAVLDHETRDLSPTELASRCLRSINW
ncbi:MAG: peptide ligase PGM1-related protein, partial [Cyanobacteria bacterium P01_H01_bin.121]